MLILAQMPHRGGGAACPEAPGMVTQPPVSFPTEGLEACGLGVAVPWHRSADLRGRAIGPGAFDEHASGMAVAGGGKRPGAALCPGGVF